jgi:sec-independent protein translocase protein TatC
MAEAGDLGRRRRFWQRLRRRRGRDASMTIVQHLSELRRRLFVCLMAFFAISIVAFIFYEPILEFVRRPLCRVDPELLGDQGCQLVFFRVIGGFLFRLKVTALTGLLFASPIWVYQVWAFVTPGLTQREKRYAVPFMVSSVTLFAFGATLAYLSLPTGIRLLVTIAGEGLSPLLGAEEYLNFVGLMLLGFGVAFELPLLLFFLGLAGVISVDQLRRQRKVALVSIVALSAIITPSQDPYTMLVLAIPLYGFYEITIVLLRVVQRRRDSRPRTGG